MYLVNIILVLIRNTKIPIKIMIAIVDSKLQVYHDNIPVCKNTRIKRCKKVKGPLYKGNNGIREWFGFKLCLITDKNGLPLFIGILPGSKHDINFLKELLNNNTMLEYLRNSVITGDKAFNSKEIAWYTC